MMLAPQSWVILASLLWSWEVDAAYPLTTDSTCNCYKTNATSSHFFAHHRFFDFRSLSQYVKEPSVLPDAASNANAPPTADYFNNPSWTSFWVSQNWNNSYTPPLNGSDDDSSDATLLMVHSPNNIYIERSTDPGSSSQTHMTMRTARLPTFQTAAEIESFSSGFQYVSVRMYARTKGAPGAVTAMFTYRPPPAPEQQTLVQEADLEIRTNDPTNFVSYTNQPSFNTNGDPVPQATRNVTLPGGRHWSDWTMYRLDWTPGSSTWYVNGQVSSTINFQTPRDPSRIMLNAWSDGGSWSGNMTINQAAYLQIQWIDVVFNNTDPNYSRSGSCRNVCTIDETSQIGTPALMTGTTSGGKSSIPTSLTLVAIVINRILSPGQIGGGGGQSGGGGQTSGCGAKKYDQCAGKNWNGCPNCPSGTNCRFQNDYYSQCL